MNLFTHTMKNISIFKYSINSPKVVVIVHIREGGAMHLGVHILWVPKGEGSITVKFHNASDFRSVHQISMSDIMAKLMESLPVEGVLVDDSDYADEYIPTDLDSCHILQTWILHGDFIHINNFPYYLTEFEVKFTMVDECMKQ